MLRWLSCLLVAVAVGTPIANAAEPDRLRERPEQKALRFLAREVPRWAAANKCYSCHNNGDAARALYTALRLGETIAPKALADTTAWLSHPEKWEHNGGEGPASDKVLARIQFAAALVDALDAGQVKDRRALARAAELVARDQQKGGSWKIDAEGTVGSPATHGTALATYFARRTLFRADSEKYKSTIAKADGWFRDRKVQNVLDAAAILLALEAANDAPAIRQRRHCLELIRRAQSKDGSWGPYINSPAEPFDTAVVLVALSRLPKDGDPKGMAERGRAFLISIQQGNGSWRETTRPGGAESYAQRISTTGWATLALLSTAAKQ